MFNSGGSFWNWLADAPAYTEVAVGLVYLLGLCPLMMAAVAWILTLAENASVAWISNKLLERPTYQSREVVEVPGRIFTNKRSLTPYARDALLPRAARASERAERTDTIVQ
jgi:hypothetical protein